jgi:hypothetical protein
VVEVSSLSRATRFVTPRRSCFGFVLLSMLLVGRATHADEPAAPAQPSAKPNGANPNFAKPNVGKQDAGDGLRALFGRPAPRGTTRVYGSIRPFLSVLGQGGGAIADFGVDHRFAEIPLRLSLEMAPLALAIEADGPGSVAHMRVGAAFSTDYLEVGASVGTRVQNYGGSGISLASNLRWGSLDGLRFTLSFGHVISRNQYSGDVGAGINDLITELQVPVSRRLAMFLEAGGSADQWIYASLGLRYRLFGDGGAGTWIVSSSFGVGLVIDRPACLHPDTGWCTDSAWAVGPTLGFGIERRF